MNASEVLLAAADLIERYGLLQGDYGDYDRGFCLVGAIDAALASDYGDHLFDEVEAELPNRCRSIVSVYLSNGQLIEILPHSWNDVPGRTAEEVIHALREAAKQ